jgi:hypothetical protein
LPIKLLAAIYNRLLERIKSGTTAISGEPRKKSGFVGLFQNLALSAIEHYQCVVMNWKLPGSQQTIFDAVVQGRASM